MSKGLSLQSPAILLPPDQVVSLGVGEASVRKTNGERASLADGGHGPGRDGPVLSAISHEDIARELNLFPDLESATMNHPGHVNTCFLVRWEGYAVVGTTSLLCFVNIPAFRFSTLVNPSASESGLPNHRLGELEYQRSPSSSHSEGF